MSKMLMQFTLHTPPNYIKDPNTAVSTESSCFRLD